MDTDSTTSAAELAGTATTKLTKEEEEYLDKLLAEKRIVEATAGLDCTQKLINAGECRSRYLNEGHWTIIS